MGVKYTGVNLAGLQFGGAGGSLWTDYVSNGQTSYDYWSNAGANTIRLPFTWERLLAATMSLREGRHGSFERWAPELCAG